MAIIPKRNIWKFIAGLNYAILIHRVTLNWFQGLRWMRNHAWEILKLVQDDTMRGILN